MKNKLSDSFFLWNYFGIDINSIPAEILDRVIELAYVDATNRKSFDRSGLSETEIKETKSKARDVVWFAVYNLSPDVDFPVWHEDVCRDLVDKTAFSYGNAQKMLNMTIKYLYLLSVSGMLPLGGEYEFLSWYNYRLKAHEADFHVPIDNYVLQYIYEDKKENSNHWGDLESITIRKYHPQYKIKDCFTNREYAWSKIPDYETYKKIQLAINDCYHPKNPLEWENEIWIEVAKKRKT